MLLNRLISVSCVKKGLFSDTSAGETWNCASPWDPSYTTNTAQAKREATREDLTASAKEFFVSVHQIKDIDGETAEQPHPLTILEFKQV